MKNKQKKNKDLDINQTSFYFEDYLEKNQKEKKKIFLLFLKIEFIFSFFYLFL